LNSQSERKGIPNKNDKKKPKKEDFTEVSLKHPCQWENCRNYIKARLVRIKKIAPKYCYEHYYKSQGKPSPKKQRRLNKRHGGGGY
jgi:hypothetical protein